jgi:putative YpdA family bacillithiol system oxidoreductase
MRKKESRMRASAEERLDLSTGPLAQHPQIDISKCIGCGSCVRACPEGDVLAVFAGKASIVNGSHCIGHGLCAEACPVGAIEMKTAPPGANADLPFLTAEYETNIENLFIAGELGGLALIKNAVNQGRECVDTIANRIKNKERREGVYDVCIIGAGPAGISASLRAIEKHLNYITLERSAIGGAVAQYPRQKLVMTSPVEFPLYGKFKKMSLSKEELLRFWHTVGQRADFSVQTCEEVEQIRKEADGIFTVSTSIGHYRAHYLILALGRRGSPRKLGIKGEELPKVMYSLIDAEAYRNQNILIVGGGDSAVEAAMGLAAQKGNRVTISYRKEHFSRIKHKNMQKVEDCIRSGRISALYSSNVIEIKMDRVKIEHEGGVLEIQNDFVWIFAGGIGPDAFLKKVGIQYGLCNVTAEELRKANSF